MIQKYSWRCPSNIALVKYWGKKDNQIPCNASVSMTLDKAYTDLTLVIDENASPDIEYFFEGKPKETFKQRISSFIKNNISLFPALKGNSMRIESVNSFPHSAGIASSASAFGALSLALLSATGYGGKDFYRKASFLARLASGSASRSVLPDFALWGKLKGFDKSSDEYAVPVNQIHQNFSDMRDTILIVDDTPKKISSSRGHALMQGHAYAKSRFRRANKHCQGILNAIKVGDYEQFITIIEQEALDLHAMMMTSENYFILLKPGTVHAMNAVTDFRRNTGIPVGFTLDAGPNVHVIYPGEYAQKVVSFIDSELKPGLKGMIFDNIGKGPKILKN